MAVFSDVQEFKVLISEALVRRAAIVDLAILIMLYY